jgi:hypothetical protein
MSDYYLLCFFFGPNRGHKNFMKDPTRKILLWVFAKRAAFLVLGKYLLGDLLLERCWGKDVELMRGKFEMVGGNFRRV